MVERRSVSQKYNGWTKRDTCPYRRTCHNAVANLSRVRQVDQIDHDLDHLDPSSPWWYTGVCCAGSVWYSLPTWNVVQDLYSTDPTRQHDPDHTDQKHILPEISTLWTGIDHTDHLSENMFRLRRFFLLANPYCICCYIFFRLERRWLQQAQRTARFGCGTCETETGRQRRDHLRRRRAWRIVCAGVSAERPWLASSSGPAARAVCFALLAARYVYTLRALYPQVGQVRSPFHHLDHDLDDLDHDLSVLWSINGYFGTGMPLIYIVCANKRRSCCFFWRGGSLWRGPCVHLCRVGSSCTTSHNG